MWAGIQGCEYPLDLLPDIVFQVLERVKLLRGDGVRAGAAAHVRPQFFVPERPHAAFGVVDDQKLFHSEA